MEKTYPRFDLPDDIKSGPAKYIQMSDITRSVLVKNADSLESGLLRPRHGKVARLGAGAVEGVAQAVKIPSALMMFGGKGLIAVGGMFGEDSAVSEWGREMIKTGARQIDVLNKSITEKSDALFGLETDERSTMAYAVGNGFGNMATMLLAAYATGGAGAVATGVAQEIAGETEKRMDTARSRGQAPEDLSAKQAAAEFSATASYGAAAGVLEKVNLSKIMPFLRTSKKPIVAAAQSAFSEASTETLQAVAAMGFGWADGTVDVSKIPQEIYDALVQGVVGGIVGGTTAGAFSLKNRHDVKNMYRDRLRGTVPEKDLETVVNSLYNASVDTMTGVVVKELSLSEELRNKHGEIYSAMMDATAKAMDASESFKHLSPDERQDYVQQTSSMFADQVLAEANRRGVAIDDVLTGAQIVFENGGIAFKNRGFTLTEDGVFEQAMYESKLESLSEFFKDVANRGVQEKRNRDRFFRVEIGGETSIVVPAQSIYHDILNHGVKEQEYVSVIESLKNPDNIKEVNISYRKNQYSGKSVILLVEANKREYAVCIDVGTNENRITSLYKTTKDGYAEQVKKGLSERRHPNNPTGSSLVAEDVRTDKPFTDIIGEPKSKINMGEKGIDNWLKKREAEVPTNNPSAPLGETPISVATSSHSLRNIIGEIRKEINTSLEQRKTVRRGSYSQAENIIRLTKDADFSTLPHELAHFWLTEQETWANTKSASDEYVDTFNLALNWLGVKDGKTINRRAQEQFARGYEQYLLDGNLPRTQDSDITPTYQRYDKWLKRVYNEMNQPSKEPLSEDIIRFFQSMTTGSLPPAVLPVAGSRFEPEKENVPAVQKKQSPSADKTPAVRSDELSGAYWRAPAAAESADGKVSQAQERQNRLNRLNGLLNEDAVSTRYEEAHLADASQKAINLIETQGIDTARKMINGDIATDDGVLRTALMIEYEQKMLAAGNVKEYTRVLRLHTLEQTRRGQEISAERLNQDITNPAYWLKRVLLMRKNNLSKDVLANMPAAASIDGRVDKFVSQTASDAAREISTAKTEAQANEAVRRVVQKVQSITGKQMELFQSDRSAVGKAYDAVYDEVARNIEDALGVTIRADEAERILAKASELAGSVKADFAENPAGNPSIETMRKIKEIKDLAASMTPTNAVALAVNSLGRANMLLSPKSALLNVWSNAETFLTEGIARRLFLKSSAKAVDSAAVRDYLKYDFDVYKASGVMMSVVRKGELDDPGRVFGERFMSSAGDGAFRAWVRKMEKAVFDWSLGAGDAVSKAVNFADNANLEATKQAAAEGYAGEGLKRRATELFNDAVLYTPQTAIGTRIRENSINAAEVSTFTNKGKIAQFSGKIRNILNDASGSARVGDFVMPFVQTPANVVSLGLEYSFGAGRALLPQNISQIARDFRTGVISDTSKSVIRSAIRNGIGWLLAFGVAELLKPDDYISPFDLASQKEKDLVRFKNGVYNSVRIGGKYISLDYFGPLAAPIAGILEAKKREGTYEKAAAFAKSVLSQAGNIPGIKEASEIAGWLDKAQKQDTLKTADDFANGVFDQLLSRSIPAIATDIAKIIDPKERVNERGIVGAAAAKIPLARENLSAKVDLSEGTERKAESPLMTLLFGARVKTADQNAVAREIERLAAAGENVRLSDFTRAKEFRDLTAKGKAQARLDFARGFTVGGLRVKGFAEQVEKLTASAVYSRKTDSQKAEAINDVTANILKRLKRKYRVKE